MNESTATAGTTVAGTTLADTTVAESALTLAFRVEVGAVDTAQASFARTRAWLGRPVFNRPAFLGADVVRDLGHDLTAIFSILRSLPERCFDGDPARMARALGLPPAQAAAVAVAGGGMPVPLGRADLMHDGTGFRLVEFNTSSSLGGCEIAEMNRAMLADPSFAAFADEHRLTHRDPLVGIMRSMDVAAGGGRSAHPLAVLTWPAAQGAAGGFGHLSLFLAALAEAGYDALPCHLGQLGYADGVLRVAGRRVEQVFRTFQLGRLDGSEESRQLAAPLLDAVADGAVTLFAPFAADLYGIKECLSLLSEDAHRDCFDAGEREVIDRMLPWTRRLRADLLPHVLEQRRELVLKPSTGYAGQGITAGWMVDPAEWTRRVTAALSSTPHVVQRRVPPAAERYLDTDTGELVRCLLSWGVFLSADGYGGAFVKGIPGGDQDIRYLGDGSHVGCVFHRTDPVRDRTHIEESPDE